MLTKVNNHSPLTVTKKELNDSRSWSKLTKERFIKQHGDVEHIPEGDNHAVPQHFDGPQIPQHNPQELQDAVGNLEDQIRQLQEKEKNMPPPAPKPEKVKDDFYDDWLNE